MKLSFGPGLLVAAAFIGPGTVTACTLAGANFGFALVWALVFATMATIILQDMAARLGAGAQLGLGEALMRSASPPIVRWSTGALVFFALFVGNCAYQSGNLSGGALGLDAILATGSPGRDVLVTVLAFAAGLIVLVGRYKFIENVLIGLVLVMSAAFIASLFVIQPDFRSILGGFMPRIPDGAMLTAIALIGTTVVPYNLFLHAAAARDKWKGTGSALSARRDSALSIGLGGLISIFILSTAATSLFQSGLEISNAADMARSLEPAFGETARYVIGLGLFAAGLTSAITAPTATAYALSEIIGGDGERKLFMFRVTALVVVFIGAIISVAGIRPVTLILIAQYANGLLLPIVASFLLFVMNRKDLLGDHTNTLVSNIAGGAIVVITFGLGLRSVLRAAGIMP